MKQSFVKICCIQNLKEAQMAIEAGACALGLVSKMPSGPGVIPEEKIREIAYGVPDSVATFLLTSETDAEKIIKQHQKVDTTTIQLVDTLETGTYQEIRDALPGTQIVQVIHVNDEQAILYALRVADDVDFILLDSGNQKAAIKQLGGTGRTHNWDISREIINSLETPVLLAGGLNPENIASAAQKVNPFGFDVCSGVRTNGKLDQQKLKNFFANIQKVQNG